MKEFLKFLQLFVLSWVTYQCQLVCQQQPAIKSEWSNCPLQSLSVALNGLVFLKKDADRLKMEEKLLSYDLFLKPWIYSIQIYWICYMASCTYTSKCANPSVWRASVISYHNLICSWRWMMWEFACILKQSEHAVACMSADTRRGRWGALIHASFLKWSERQLQDPTDVQREAMVAKDRGHRQFQMLTKEAIGSG